MDLEQIQAGLNHSDYSYRIQALKALKAYDAEVAVPLLISKLKDPHFLVRSFVARGLGNKRNADSFAALLEMVKLEQDSNVKAEAANSLSFFEQIAVPHLVLAFHQNPNWLVRRSILAAMIEMNVEIGCSEALIEICVQALSDEDITVQEDGIEGLRSLAGGSQHAAALSQLLNLVNSDSWQVRRRTARALKQFSDPQARAALSQLSQDADHRVVAAVLEDLLPE